MQSVHKPMTSIIKKPTGEIIIRMQKMILKLLKYDINIKHSPRKDIFLADVLSRTFFKDDVFDDPDMLYKAHSISKYLPVSDRKVN